MLEQDGEAGRRVLAPAEAQQGESRCYSAMLNASQNLDLNVLFASTSLGEEEEEEEGRKEEEVGEALGLPPTLGGGERTSAQQVDGGARCSLHSSSCQEP